jgi:hypothetical protein
MSRAADVISAAIAAGSELAGADDAICSLNILTRDALALMGAPAWRTRGRSEGQGLV